MYIIIPINIFVKYVYRNYLKNTIEKLENPRSQGKLLRGKYKGSWRYRVGNYRLLATINDKKVLIYVFEIGHRREVYR